MLGWTAAVVIAGVVAGQPEQPRVVPAPRATPSEALARQIQQLHDASLPGEAIGGLSRMIGEWTVEMTLLVNGREISFVKGTATIGPTLGGRALRTSVTGSIVLGGLGLPFEGEGTTTWDTGSAAYESTWISTLSSTALVRRGAFVGDVLVLDARPPGDSRTIRTEMRFHADGSIEMLTLQRPDAGDVFVPTARTLYSRVEED